MVYNLKCFSSEMKNPFSISTCIFKNIYLFQFLSNFSIIGIYFREPKNNKCIRCLLIKYLDIYQLMIEI